MHAAPLALALVALLVLPALCVDITAGPTTIQTAIAGSTSGETINMAAGTYSTSSIILFPTNKVLTLNGANPATTIIDCGGGAGLKVDQGSLQITIQGITVRNCNNGFGSALNIIGSSPLISNVVFTANQATGPFGPVYLKQSNATFSRVTFHLNKAVNGSGGALAMLQSAPTFSNCAFTSNDARANGGAVYLWQSQARMSNCTLQNNTAITQGGNSFGGAIYMFNSAAELEEIVIDGNRAGGDGGGVYSYSSDLTASFPIQNAKISNNIAAGSGGGLYLYAVGPTLIDVTIEKNQAGVSGGGLYLYSSANGPSLINFVIKDNTAAGGDGGGAYMNIYLGPDSVPAEIRNGLVQGNIANSGNGGGIVVSGFSGTQTAHLSDLTVLNNAVFNIGKGGGIYVFDISPSISNLTASGNSAGSDGGGLWLASYLNFVNTSLITKSTFNSNFANGTGGGIWLHSEAVDSFPIIDSTTVQDNAASNGAGIYAEYKTNQQLLIRGSYILSNTAKVSGAGLYLSMAQPVIQNTEIRGNTATDGLGGGVFVTGFISSVITPTPTITGSIIANNHAGIDGGGASLADTIPTVTNSTFTANTAVNNGGGISLQFSELARHATISTTTFDQNSATDGGGVSAISFEDCYAETACALPTTCAVLSISGSKFTANQGHTTAVTTVSGGAIAAQGVFVTASSTEFTSNVATGVFGEASGGAISLQASCTDFSTLTFTNNLAEGVDFGAFGGAIISTSSGLALKDSTLTSNAVRARSLGTGAVGGGGLVLTSGKGQITSSSFTNNSATCTSGFRASGGGILVREQSVAQFTNVTVTQNSALGSTDSNGAGFALITEAQVSITDSSISQNQGDGNGGGIYASSLTAFTPAVLNGVTVEANVANNGAGLYLAFAVVDLSLSTVFNNTARVSGGAGFVDTQSRLTLAASSATYNSASYQGGFYSRVLSNVVNDSITIIAYNNPDYFEDTYAPSCIAFGDGIDDAHAGLPNAFTILSRDRVEKNVPHGGDSYTIAITELASGQAITANITDNSDGSYTVDYFPLKSGPHRFNIALGGESIRNFPANISVVAGDASLSLSTVSHLEGTSACSKGDIELYMNDDNGNIVDQRDLTFVAYIANEDLSLKVDLQVEPVGSGKFLASYYLPMGGEFQVYASIARIGSSIQRNLTSSPFTLTLNSIGTHICSNVMVITFSVFISIIGISILGLIPVILILHRRWPIRNSNWVFSLLVLIGSLMVVVGVVMIMIEPTIYTCNAHFWLWGLGWTLLFAPMVAKNLIVWRSKRAGTLEIMTEGSSVSSASSTKSMASLTVKLHQQKTPNKPKKVVEVFVAPITPTKPMLLITLIMILVQLIVLVLWTTLSPPYPKQTDISVRLGGDVTVACKPNTAGLIFFYIYMGLAIIAGMASGMATSSIIRANLNEEVFLVFSIYNVAFVTVLEVLFTFVVESFETALALRAACLLYSVAIVVVAIFVPKLYFTAKHKLEPVFKINSTIDRRFGHSSKGGSVHSLSYGSSHKQSTGVDSSVETTTTLQMKPLAGNSSKSRNDHAEESRASDTGDEGSESNGVGQDGDSSNSNSESSEKRLTKTSSQKSVPKQQASSSAIKKQPSTKSARKPSNDTSSSTEVEPETEKRVDGRTSSNRQIKETVISIRSLESDAPLKESDSDSDTSSDSAFDSSESSDERNNKLKRPATKKSTEKKKRESSSTDTEDSGSS